MKEAGFALIFVVFFLIVGCASNEALKPKLRGDANWGGEELLEAISDGGKSERHEAIEKLSKAFTTLTNRTPAQLELVEMPDKLINVALGHPFEHNGLAKLWFDTVEVLIDELRTEDREAAGIVLVHMARAPWPPKHDVWSRDWPEIKKRYIGIMDQNKE